MDQGQINLAADNATKKHKGPYDLIRKVIKLDTVYLALVPLGALIIFFMAWMAATPNGRAVENAIMIIMALAAIPPIILTVLYIIAVIRLVSSKVPISRAVIVCGILHLYSFGLLVFCICNILLVEDPIYINPQLALGTIIICLVLMNWQAKELHY